MIKDYKYYVEKYIQYRSKMCQSPDDYGIINTRVHNKAVDNLNSLIAEMLKDIDVTKKVYSILLENENSFIQQNSAGECLELTPPIHVEKSIEILEHTIQYGEIWEIMGAERTLKIWRGEINPDDPW